MAARDVRFFVIESHASSSARSVAWLHVGCDDESETEQDYDSDDAHEHEVDTSVCP